MVEIMTAKEQAEYFFHKYTCILYIDRKNKDVNEVKKCILNITSGYIEYHENLIKPEKINRYTNVELIKKSINYWIQVKQEIQKL